jgi:hypothetical protein
VLFGKLNSADIYSAPPVRGAARRRDTSVTKVGSHYRIKPTFNEKKFPHDHERKPVDQESKEADREAQLTRASHRAAVRTTYRTLTLVPFPRATRGRAPSMEPA